ncbi:T-cell surface glycoprotein CD1b-2-like [Rhynchonycteris naso]
MQMTLQVLITFKLIQISSFVNSTCTQNQGSGWLDDLQIHHWDSDSGTAIFLKPWSKGNFSDVELTEAPVEKPRPGGLSGELPDSIGSLIEAPPEDVPGFQFSCGYQTTSQQTPLSPKYLTIQQRNQGIQILTSGVPTLMLELYEQAGAGRAAPPASQWLRSSRPAPLPAGDPAACTSGSPEPHASIQDVGLYPFEIQARASYELHPGKTTVSFRRGALGEVNFMSFQNDTCVPAAEGGSRAQRFCAVVSEYQGISSIIEKLLSNTCPRFLLDVLDAGKAELQTRLPESLLSSGYTLLPGHLLLVCHVSRFYPKPVQVMWMRGEQEHLGTHQGDILPNADGTWYLQVNLDIVAGEEANLNCRVKHSSLGGQDIVLHWGEKELSLAGNGRRWFTNMEGRASKMVRLSGCDRETRREGGGRKSKYPKEEYWVT